MYLFLVGSYFYYKVSFFKVSRVFYLCLISFMNYVMDYYLFIHCSDTYISDLFGEAFDVIVTLLGFLPLAPPVGFTVLVSIHAHSGRHLLDPGTGADVIVGGLCDQIEASLGEPDVGIGVALADFPAEGERLVDA